MMENVFCLFRENKRNSGKIVCYDNKYSIERDKYQGIRVSF